VYINTGSPVPSIPSKSRSLAGDNKKVFDRMEMIRNKRIGHSFSLSLYERSNKVPYGVRFR